MAHLILAAGWTWAALAFGASRADTAVAILAAERMDAHAAALQPRALASR
ncbi:hypothetical protein [Streptomyces sp. NPDC021139]